MQYPKLSALSIYYFHHEVSVRSLQYSPRLFLCMIYYFARTLFHHSPSHFRHVMYSISPFVYHKYLLPTSLETVHTHSKIIQPPGHFPLPSHISQPLLCDSVEIPLDALRENACESTWPSNAPRWKRKIPALSIVQGEYGLTGGGWGLVWGRNDRRGMKGGIKKTTRREVKENLKKGAWKYMSMVEKGGRSGRWESRNAL